MPQALNILEKFKAEVGTTPKGRANSGDEYVVSFVQAQIWAQSMVSHHCGVKVHRVNECPKLTHAQRKQFWDDRNKHRRGKSNTALKECTAHAAVAKDANPAEDYAARLKYKQYQRLMSAIEELYVGMVQVGCSDTGVVEDKNAGVNLSSRGTSNPGKQVYFAKNMEHVSRRFTLDANKL